MNKFTTWLLIVLAVAFPVLKVWTYLAFKPAGDPMNQKVQLMLNAWSWLTAWL